MGCYACPTDHGHSACKGFSPTSNKKSLARSAQANLAGQAKAGRDTNTTRKGYLVGAQSSSVNWAATLLNKGTARLHRQHFRYRPEPIGSRILHCVLLDLSASMLRGRKLELAKGALLALSEQFYHRREKMAVIGFSGTQARVIQPAGRVPTFNLNWIAPLQGAGATPISHAVDLLEEMLGQHKCRSAKAVTTVWLMSDGRFDPLPARPEMADCCHVLDFEMEDVRLGRAQRLAQTWDASYTPALQFSPEVAPVRNA